MPGTGLAVADGGLREAQYRRRLRLAPEEGLPVADCGLREAQYRICNG